MDNSGFTKFEIELIDNITNIVVGKVKNMSFNHIDDLERFVHGDCLVHHRMTCQGYSDFGECSDAWMWAFRRSMLVDLVFDKLRRQGYVYPKSLQEKRC